MRVLIPSSCTHIINQNKVTTNNIEPNRSYYKCIIRSKISSSSITEVGGLLQLIMKTVLVLTPLLQWTGLLIGQVMDWNWIWKDLTRDIEDFATLNGVWATSDTIILDKTWLIY